MYFNTLQLLVLRGSRFLFDQGQLLQAGSHNHLKYCLLILETTIFSGMTDFACVLPRICNQHCASSPEILLGEMLLKITAYELITFIFTRLILTSSPFH